MKRKLIAGILCIAMLIPCAMFNTFASDVADGTVLYHQQFGKGDEGNNIVADIAGTGITFYDNDVYEGSDGKERHIVEVNDTTGFIKAGTTDNQDFICLSLPEDLTAGVDTYTLEMTYRYRPNVSNKSRAQSMLGFAWANKGKDFSQQTPTKGESNTGEYTIIAPKINYTDNYFPFDSSGYRGDNKVSSKWQLSANGSFADTYGEWVTVKLCVKGGMLYGAYLCCNGLSWSSKSPEGEISLSGDLGIYMNDGGADISSIRVVAGTTASVDAQNGYTDYNGTYAVRSYNGYEPNVHTRGAQLGVSTENEGMARLVGQIRGRDFKKAGFLVQITNGDDVSVVKRFFVHVAYTSLKQGEDGTIAPSWSKNSEYCLIAMEIDLNDASVSTENLKITFQPYAIDADDNIHYGITYDFDCINKVTTRALTQLNEVT